MLESFLGDKNFEFQYFFLFFFFFGGGGVERRIFLGMKILWIFFGVIQNWISVRGYFDVFYVVFFS